MGNVTFKLHNADCLTVLRKMKDKSVDIVVTSPPYNTLTSIVSSSSNSIKWVKKTRELAYEDDMPEDVYQSWLSSIIAECLRVAKGIVWVNHKTRYRKGVAIVPHRFMPFPICSEVVWERSGTVQHSGKRYPPNFEYIIGFGESHYWDRVMNYPLAVWRHIDVYVRPTKLHPCSFPVEIPKRLITSSCPVGGTVLDPFAGIATTGQAAIRLGRNFIGMEKDRRFWEKGITILKTEMGERTARKEGMLF